MVDKQILCAAIYFRFNRCAEQLFFHGRRMTTCLSEERACMCAARSVVILHGGGSVNPCRVYLQHRDLTQDTVLTVPLGSGTAVRLIVLNSQKASLRCCREPA